MLLVCIKIKYWVKKFQVCIISFSGLHFQKDKHYEVREHIFIVHHV